jgi:putative toxin-antitoxin system antitoxin component (TIGR02293 family)
MGDIRKEEKKTSETARVQARGILGTKEALFPTLKGDEWSARKRIKGLFEIGEAALPGSRHLPPLSNAAQEGELVAQLIKDLYDDLQTHPTVLHWFGKADIQLKQVNSEFDLIQLGQLGLPKSAILELASKLGVSKKTMAEDILDISVKTIDRKADTEILDKKTSSHAVEIAKTLQHAYEVFEDDDKVKSWVNKENRALNGKKPVQMFDTLTGINMVNDILTRIEEGIYS